ncbi:phosphoenolpyruvate--protein phosphotransferase [Oscillospiraceae bacterium MB08-C2-2]|nr:phosphoenolpyruvate--protein phosphotransferase [Oscillospiraceae bacterium MB08-C2-2]
MTHLTGRPGAPGVAQGKIIVLKKAKVEAQTGPVDPAEEKSKLELALAQCLEQTRALHSEMLERLGEEDAKIIKAYLMMLEDKTLITPIFKEIEKGESAPAAIQGQTDKLAQMFAGMKNDYMRQRADDIRHVGQMLIDRIHGVTELVLPHEPCVLVAEDLSPVDTLKLDKNHLAGMVTQLGGVTSHTVILAKTLGKPAIIGVQDIYNVFEEGQQAILDGSTGDIYINPDEETIKRYQTVIKGEQAVREKIRSANLTKGITTDGFQIQICANVGNAEDMVPLEPIEYDGIGLFRTEFVYSAFTRYPTFEEQREAYSAVVKAAKGRPVIIRTLDIGGDKALVYFGLEKEENPFLGYRAIRVCLDRQEVFLDQLMAILASSAHGKVRIMFPMITELRELTEGKKLVEKAKALLAEKNIDFDSQVPVGIMVETPASAVMADRFAPHCDFISIGTNDLTQYVTCTDRINPNIQNLYNPYNPAVLRLIAHTIRSGAKVGTEVGVCGELAGDLDFVPLLIGFGVSKLSAASGLVERVRYLVCNVSRKEMEELADKALEMDDPDAVRQMASAIRHKVFGA